MSQAWEGQSLPLAVLGSYSDGEVGAAQDEVGKVTLMSESNLARPYKHMKYFGLILRAIGTIDHI